MEGEKWVDILRSYASHTIFVDLLSGINFLKYSSHIDSQPVKEKMEAKEYFLYSKLVFRQGSHDNQKLRANISQS